MLPRDACCLVSLAIERNWVIDVLTNFRIPVMVDVYGESRLYSACSVESGRQIVEVISVKVLTNEEK